VALLSLVSNAKEPVVPTISRATPLLARLPATHSCTSDVMSISTNWSALAAVNVTGCPPVAEAPSAGALL
jgi:hypothetical protein